MPRALRLLAAAAVLASAACVSAPPPEPRPAPGERRVAAAAKLRIGVVGDQTGAADLDAAYRVLARGVAELARYHREVAPLDVVLHVGDLVESASPPDEVTRRFRQAAALLDGLPAPWYLTAGDHDVNPPAYRQNSPDRSREELFESLYGPRIPGFQGHLWYSLDVGRHHVVVLDSQQALHADPRWGDVFLAEVRRDQLDWLRRDLEAHRDAAGVVVLLHQPHWYHWSNWQRVHELLRGYPVALVLNGHLHYQQDGGTLDGIRYLGVGATGGDTKEGSVQAGDVQHVSVIEVDGRQVTKVELLPLDAAALQLTPRREMDRVQALDVMLGNLWDLAQRNPIFRRGETLVADCASGAPARITVTGLGNPIDLPAGIRIDVASPVRLAGAAFAPGMCESGGGAGTCLAMPVPTPNVYSSNDSGVSLDAAAPLWSAEVVSAGSAAAVELTFLVSFQPDSGSGYHVLERKQSIPIGACP